MVLPRTRWKRARPNVVAALVALSLLGVACGSRPDPLDIGLRRVALDLAFKDAALAEPPADPTVIRRFIDEEILFEDELETEPEPEFFEPRPRTVNVPRRLPAEPPCPKSDPVQTPAIPAFTSTRERPGVGAYKRHNTGTFLVELGAGAGAAAGVPSSFTLPFPPRTIWQIRNVKEVFESTYVNAEDVKQVPVPATVRDNTTAFPKRVEFEMVRANGRLATIIDTFRYNPAGDSTGDLDFLWLVKRVTIVGSTTKEFNPSPPIRYFPLFEAEGDSLNNHGGVDRATDTAMTVESAIVSREVVDICGENFDSYRVEIRERMVDLSKNPPDESGNDLNGPPTVWNVEFGNLNVLRVIDTSYMSSSLTLDTDGAGPRPAAPVPVRLRFNYSSILDKIEPDPLETAPAPAPASPPAPEETGGGGGGGEEESE